MSYKQQLLVLAILVGGFASGWFLSFKYHQEQWQAKYQALEVEYEDLKNDALELANSTEEYIYSVDGKKQQDLSECTNIFIDNAGKGAFNDVYDMTADELSDWYIGLCMKARGYTDY